MSGQGGDLDWVIGQLAKVKGVRHVLVAAQDGIPMVRSASLNDGGEADTLAAQAAGYRSLGRQTAGKYGTGELHQVMTRYEGGALFVTGAAEGSCLAVVADPGFDPAEIAREMQATVLGVGKVLAARARVDTGP